MDHGIAVNFDAVRAAIRHATSYHSQRLYAQEKNN
jgi:hypothetical protein